MHGAALACFLVLATGVLLMEWQGRRVVRLADQPPWPAGKPAPKLSIIAPALNEAAHIEAAVRALCAQRYPDFELLVVNDRSTDATGDILARLERELPELRVLHVRELPGDWLGKNHANWLAAGQARGDLLLFTDADVVMQPDAVRRAVAYLEAGKWDHLAVAPQARLPGRILGQFPLYFGLLFSFYARPWAARNPRSRAHVGIGAFNLVRRDAYFAVDGHRGVRLRPDEDMRLGRLIKHAGFRQDFVNGVGQVSVQWYESWRAVRDGLMKNLYAGSGYSIALTVFGSIAHWLLLAGPVAALPFSHGSTLALNAGSLALMTWQGWRAAPQFGTARWAGILLPLFASFGAWLMWRSMLLAHLNGGISWRGTFYPLERLRRPAP